MTNPAALHRLAPHDSDYCDNKEKLRRNFNANTKDHVMTILHDDGLYRHIKFRSTENGFYWFDLITWPGSLTINGDMGTYTFSRVEDMFTFFAGYINSDYWAEKEQSRTSSDLKEHDGDEFKRWIVQEFWEYSRDLDASMTKDWWEAIREHVFDDFSYDTSHRQGCNEAIDAITDSAPHGNYEDIWELSWSTYPWHFEWCLAAIVTGIRTYTAVKKAEFLAVAIAVKK